MRETVLKWGSQSTTWLYVLLAYPVIDYVLRKILPIPVVSSFWDEALLLVLLGFTFIAFLQSNRTMPKIKHLLVAFLVLGIALTVTDMANWDASVEGFRSVYQYILAFLMGFYLLQSLEQLDKLLKGLALVGFLAGLVGVIQVVIGVQTPESWVQEGEAITTRAFSFVTSPNVLGSYMALIAPVAAGLLLKAPSRKEKIVWAVVTSTTLLALLLTGSRGAWFALAFSLFLCCYLWNKKIAGYLVLIGIVGVVALFFVPESVPLVGTIKNRIFTLFTPLEGGRLGRWGEAYDKMSSRKSCATAWLFGAASAGFALLAFLPLLAFCYYVVHPEERRPVLVFTVGVLLLDRALTRVDVKTTAALLIGGAVAVIVVALLANGTGA